MITDPLIKEYLFHSRLHWFREFFDGRVAAVFGLTSGLGPPQGVQPVVNMHRQLNGPALIANRRQYTLFDPPRRVRTETKPPFGIELVTRPRQPQYTFLR